MKRGDSISTVFAEPKTSNDLEHYGRKGMKWYQHIFSKDPQIAYDKANKKLSTLDARANKAAAKATRKENRSVRRQQRADTAWVFKKSKARLADWAIGRSEKARLKYVKKMSKAVDWYNRMQEEFKDTKVKSLNKEYVALGKKYSKMQIDDLMKNAQTSYANKQLRLIYRQMSK